MTRWFFTFFGACLAFCASPTFAQTMNIDTIEVDGLEPVTVPPSVTRITIKTVRVGFSERAPAQLVIKRVKARTNTDQDPFESPTRPGAPPVAIRIGEIVAATGAASHLQIQLRDLHASELYILRDGPSDADIIVDLETNDADVMDVHLRGGRYGKVALTLAEQDGLGQHFNLAIAGGEVRDLKLVGAGRLSVTTLNISTALASGTTSSVEISKLQIDRADIRFSSSSDINQFDADGRTECGQRVSISLNDLWIGPSRGDQTPERWKDGDASFDLPRGRCFKLALSDIDINGGVRFAGGLIEELALSSVTSAPDDKGIEISSRSIDSLKLLNVSLSNLTMADEAPSDAPPLALLGWRNVSVIGTVELPLRVYDSLNQKLAAAPRDPSLVGIRRFLVESRWNGYVTGDRPRRIAKQSTAAVLESDARSIYGDRGAIALRVLTGYGIYLGWPIICFSILLLLPGIIILIRARKWSAAGAYYQGLLGVAQPTSKFALYAIPIQRVLIAILIGLVTLFIQNAVLAGTT